MWSLFCRASLLKLGSSRRLCDAMTGLRSLLVCWWNGAMRLGRGLRLSIQVRLGRKVLLGRVDAQFRREQLSGEIMGTMVEAKYLAVEWKDNYIHERPLGPLDGLTPSRFWNEWVRENQLAIP